MCEQAGTGLRMMRESWRKLGHPAPHYKNDRAGKAFEFFIPELDKEVDMASDLVKAMFGDSSQPKAQVEAQEAQVEAQVKLSRWQLDVLSACSAGEKTARELIVVAGYRSRTGNFKKGLQRLVDESFLEPTLPDKPNSRLQKYRLTAAGRQTLSARSGSMQ